MLDTLGKKGFQLLHLNIRSIWPKIELIRQMLNHNGNISVFTISESWLTGDLPDELLNIENYMLFRLDRSWGDRPNMIKKRRRSMYLYQK